MSSSEDVKTLFRRFGGEPGTYQEVVRERQTLQSLNKWTMLGQVELNHPQTIPSARRTVKGSAVRPLLEETYPEIAEVLAVEHSIASPPAAISVPISAPPTVAVHQEHKLVAATPATPRAAWVAAPRVQPSVETVAPILASESKPAPRISPLAARLKAPIAAPATTDTVEAKNGQHSLVGLFGRLSKPQLPSPQAGVLRRKFIK